MSDQLASWERRQYKTYSTWLKHVLSLSGQAAISDSFSLEKDLSDGKLLINVVETLTRAQVRGKCTRSHLSRIQKLNNLHALFQHLKSINCDPSGVSIESICDGNIKQILGLLWVLLLNFQIRKSVEPRLNEGDAASAALAAHRSSNTAERGQRVSQSAAQQQDLIRRKEEELARTQQQRSSGRSKKKRKTPTSTATAVAALDNELYAPLTGDGTPTPSAQQTRTTDSVRDTLLARVNEAVRAGAAQEPGTSGSPRSLTSFRRGLADGKVLRSLVASVRPDLAASLPPATTSEASPVLVQAALDLLHDQFGVPRLLSAEDILNGDIDEPSMMAFFAMAIDALDGASTRPKLSLDAAKTTQSGQVWLLWVQPATSASRHIRHYEVERAPVEQEAAIVDIKGDQCTFEMVGNTANLSFVDHLIVPKTAYVFRVRAAFDVGFSAWSNLVRYPESGAMSDAAKVENGTASSSAAQSALQTAEKLYAAASRALHDPKQPFSTQTVALGIDELVKRAREIATQTNDEQVQRNLMESTRALVEAGERMIQTIQKSRRSSARFREDTKVLLAAVDGYVNAFQGQLRTGAENEIRPNSNDVNARTQLDSVLTTEQDDTAQVDLKQAQGRAQQASQKAMQSLSEFPSAVDALVTANAVGELAKAALSGHQALEAGDPLAAARTRDAIKSMISAADEYVSSAIVANNHPDTPRTRARFNGSLENLRFSLGSVVRSLDDPKDSNNRECADQASEASNALANTQKITPRSALSDPDMSEQLNIEDIINRAQDAAVRVKNSVSNHPSQVNTHGVANAVHSLVYEAQAAANQSAPARQKLLLASAHALLASAQDYLNTVAVCAENESPMALKNLQKRSTDLMRAAQHVLATIKGTGPMEVERAAKQALTRLRGEHDLLSKARQAKTEAGDRAGNVEKARVALGRIHANQAQFTELVDPLAIAGNVHELLKHAREIAVTLPAGKEREKILGLAAKVAVAAEQYVAITGEAARDPTPATLSLWSGRARVLEDVTQKLLRALAKSANKRKDRTERTEEEDNEIKLAATVLSILASSMATGDGPQKPVASPRPVQIIAQEAEAEQERLLSALDAPTDALSVAAATARMVSQARESALVLENDKLKEAVLDRAKNLLLLAQKVVEDVYKGKNGRTDTTEELSNTAANLISMFNLLAAEQDDKALQVAKDFKQGVSSESVAEQADKIKEVIKRIQHSVSSFSAANNDKFVPIDQHAQTEKRTLISAVNHSDRLELDAIPVSVDRLKTMAEHVSFSSPEVDFSDYLYHSFRALCTTLCSYLSTVSNLLYAPKNRQIKKECKKMNAEFNYLLRGFVASLIHSPHVNTATEADGNAGQMRLNVISENLRNPLNAEDAENIKAASSSLPAAFNKLQKTHNSHYADPLSVVEGAEGMINQVKLQLSEGKGEGQDDLIKKAEELVQVALKYIDASVNASAEPWRDDLQLEFENTVDDLSQSASNLAKLMNRKELVDSHPPPKKRKRRIKWADDEGGSLEHILNPAHELQDSISGVRAPAVDINAVLQLVKALVLEGKRASETAESEEDKLIIKGRCQALSAAAKRFVIAIQAAGDSDGDSDENALELSNANAELAHAVRGLRSCFGASPAEEEYERNKQAGVTAQDQDAERKRREREMDEEMERKTNEALANLNVNILNNLLDQLKTIVKTIDEPLDAEIKVDLQEKAAKSGEETRTWARFLIERKPLEFLTKSVDIFGVTKHIGHELKAEPKQEKLKDNLSIWGDLFNALKQLLSTMETYVDLAGKCVSGTGANANSTTASFMAIHGPLVEHTRGYLECLQRALDSFALLCAACGEKVVGDYMKTEDNLAFHKHCLCCCVCNTPLKKYLIMDSNMYCSEHVPKSPEVICAFCNEEIEGEYMEAIGKAFHNDHFKCSKCGVVLDGPYTELDDKAYCGSCVAEGSL